MRHFLETSHVKLFLILGFISFMFGSIYKQFGIFSILLAILGAILMINCIVNISVRRYIDGQNKKNSK